MEVKLHKLLSSSLNGRKWSVSRSGLLIPGDRSPLPVGWEVFWGPSAGPYVMANNSYIKHILKSQSCAILHFIFSGRRLYRCYEIRMVTFSFSKKKKSSNFSLRLACCISVFKTLDVYYLQVTAEVLYFYLLTDASTVWSINLRLHKQMQIEIIKM